MSEVEHNGAEAPRLTCFVPGCGRTMIARGLGSSNNERRGRWICWLHWHMVDLSLRSATEAALASWRTDRDPAKLRQVRSLLRQCEAQVMERVSQDGEP